LAVNGDSLRQRNDPGRSQRSDRPSPHFLTIIDIRENTRHEF
jgi:hypothetical protein